MVRTDIEPATELDNRRTMSESVLFLLILFENHPRPRGAFPLLAETHSAPGPLRTAVHLRSRQSQHSTTGPPEAAVLIQAARTNVQLQGRWGQRSSYGAAKAKFNYRAFGQGGSVLADRFLNIPRYFLPCHTPAVT